MPLISLICPHCSENFELDSESLQQSFWVCPNCGNRSLLQRTNDSIRLRGIITARPNPTNANLPPVIIQSATALPEAPAQLSDDLVPDLAPVEPLNLDDRSSTERALYSNNSSEAVRQFLSGSLAAAGSPAPEAIPSPPFITPPAAKEASPVPSPPEPTVSDIDRLCSLAEKAAEGHDLPLFNVYSRQALDCQPRDARIYALRATLTEEADGFARATWDALGWTLLTPKRKKSIIAQHLYNFNTTIKYGGVNKHQKFIQHIAWQLVQQVIDIFTEQAEIRCQKHMINKTFEGRYKKSDFKSADKLIDAINLIDQQTCPIAFLELLNAIRSEIKQVSPRIARRLRKI